METVCSTLYTLFGIWAFMGFGIWFAVLILYITTDIIKIDDNDKQLGKKALLFSLACGPLSFVSLISLVFCVLCFKTAKDKYHV